MKKYIINILIVICLIFLFISSGKIFFYFYEAYETNKKIESIMENTKTNTKDRVKVNNKEILPELSKLYTQNEDLIGTLEIKNTKVNYPVMQNTSNKDFYLSHDFYKEKDTNGLPFLDYRSDWRKPSTNLIIHGHNMKDGSMFNTLNKYKNKGFYSSHKIINFNTLYEKSEYEIISVFLSRVYDKNENVFKYYNFIEAHDEEDFNSFIRNIRSLSLYRVDADVKFGDSLITLSTCEYSEEDGRLVIVARKKD